MPMTTCSGRKPAISSASWSATAQLSTTAEMSATVPDCMWRSPWRFRPTPFTIAVARLLDLEDERLRELRPDVERRAGGEAPPASPRSRAAAGTVIARRQARMRKQPVNRCWRGRARLDRRERLAERPPASCRGPGPSRAARRPCHRSRGPRAWTSVARGDALRDRGLVDGDEDLRLVGVEAERDDVRRRAPTEGPWRSPSSRRSTRTAPRA